MHKYAKMMRSCLTDYSHQTMIYQYLYHLADTNLKSEYSGEKIIEIFKLSTLLGAYKYFLAGWKNHLVGRMFETLDLE